MTAAASTARVAPVESWERFPALVALLDGRDGASALAVLDAIAARVARLPATHPARPVVERGLVEARALLAWLVAAATRAPVHPSPMTRRTP